MRSSDPLKPSSDLQPPTKRVKDVDSVERVRFLHAAAWLAPVSLVFFGITTRAASQLWGLGPGMSLLIGLSLGLAGPWVAYGLLYKYFIGGTASFLGKLYYSEESTPRAPTGWRAQALSVRGAHSEALQAYEEEAALYPDDPGPCLRAAAFCLQELDDPGLAIRFFLRAREAAGTTPETDAYLSARLAELYEAAGSAEEAASEMRRILEHHPDSQHAAGARARLAALKRIQLGEPNSGQSG
jgi:tetratricopeptide (TPR) repeat protein